MSGIKKWIWPLVMLVMAGALVFVSCNSVDLYEKDAFLPAHQWKSSYKPSFKFSIKDTTAPYQMYIVLRHNEKYNYNNIWLNLYAQAPGQPVQKFMLELPLATNDNGWLGTAMDDLYEHRIPLTLDPEKFNFKKTGDYNFTIEQVMREDPLENILNVGLRIEKKTP